MDVSIIIVNYNSIDLTIDCVNSIFQQTADVKFEIIIVDNASKNKEAERLQAEFENSVKMIEAETNLGFGKANNLGTKYAAGDYVFYTKSRYGFDEQCSKNFMGRDEKQSRYGMYRRKFIYTGENAVSVFLFKV